MNLLSGEALVQQNQQLQKNTTPSLARGQKKTHPEPGDDAELKTLYDDLRTTLSLERIERVTVRSQADYEPHRQPNCVRVTRKMGKWHLYGYTRFGNQYLHPHEALHLIEMNRLELYYNRVLVTLQQAYALLLPNSRLTSEAYFVYSHLMRVGCVVELFSNEQDRSLVGAQRSKHSVSQSDRIAERTQSQCVWLCVYLLQTGNVARYLAENNDNRVRETLQQLAAHSDRIRRVGHSDVDDDMNEDDEDDGGWNVEPGGAQKRKGSDQLASAVEPKAGEYRAEPFLDRLRSNDSSEEMARFADVFRSIDTYRLSTVQRDSSAKRPPRLRIDFDLHLAPGAFRKTAPGKPDYRVIVRRSDAGVPTRGSIVETHLWQRYRARLLVVFVSESMAMQAYAYSFEH